MSKESDGSRYLRSTISNIAFLAAIGYFVHEKALSETSLVTIMTLFIGGYFGVRAYQHRAEADIAASQSNPRFPIPNYRTPPNPPEDPPTAGGPHTATTRKLEAQSIPRTDEMPTNPGGRGRFKRWITSLIHSGFAPITFAIAGAVVWILVYSVAHQINTIASIGGLQ